MIRGLEFRPSNVESNSIIVHHVDGNHAFPEGILTEAIEYWYSSLYLSETPSRGFFGSTKFCQLFSGF